MRSLRLIFLVVCFGLLTVFLTFSSLIHSHQPQGGASSNTGAQKGGIRAFFSFTTPSSLFPPSAIISLTDDNSTFFLSRLAGFGPYLPQGGLSGQLWVGSGFGDDGITTGGATTRAEGELGCSDIPGWTDGKTQYTGDQNEIEGKAKSGSPTPDLDLPHPKASTGREQRNHGSDGTDKHPKNDRGVVPNESDGTDDHLHYPLSSTKLLKTRNPGQHTTHDASKGVHPPQHADIQSLQESAEISGKVVLLSRGGCGFLEKVKWAQRRGGIAVIVGDDTRGGPLVTMWAHGDTSNVTIPSLFTSHTTAHLLSSLIPLGGPMDGSSSEAGAMSDDRAGLAASKKKGEQKSKTTFEGPTFTPFDGFPRPTGTTRPSTIPASGRQTLPSSNKESANVAQGKRGWIRSIASAFGLDGRASTSSLSSDSRRPPSSGRMNWVISENWNDDAPVADEKKEKAKTQSNPDKKASSKANSKASQGSDDDFVIGVQDWRDPDLISNVDSKNVNGKETTKTKSASNPNSPSGTGSLQKSRNGLSGGSITPGSGEYGKPDQGSPKPSSQQPNSQLKSTGKDSSEDEGWLSRLLWGPQDETIPYDIEEETRELNKQKLAPQVAENLDFKLDKPANVLDGHEGLWVTMTPAKTTSPFFDTLLVLVVSPLVTLTVVYALLLIRSRIRRRRWRAPKSVVERLPVRTYQTIATPPSPGSSHAASPINSTATSPLLQSTLSRTRPRSRTTSGIGDNIAASLTKASNLISLDRSEKNASRSSPKKRYNGKQVECVICLEEYIDGQSRVMRLPCGHEFHAECITPWLTTRRRTCPICKGDVVRSLANGGSSSSSSSSSPILPSYHDAPDSQDIQDQAFESTNDSPSSAIPIPRSADLDDDGDLERGEDLAATLVNDEPDHFSPRRGWRGLAASLSLSAFSGEAAWRQSQADRNR